MATGGRDEKPVRSTRSEWNVEASWCRERCPYEANFESTINWVEGESVKGAALEEVKEARDGICGGNAELTATACTMNKTTSNSRILDEH